MTLQEKITAAEALIAQATEQAKNWETNRLVAIGRLQVLQEMVAEDAAEKEAAANANTAEIAAVKP